MRWPCEHIKFNLAAVERFEHSNARIKIRRLNQLGETTINCATADFSNGELVALNSLIYYTPLPHSRHGSLLWSRMSGLNQQTTDYKSVALTIAPIRHSTSSHEWLPEKPFPHWRIGKNKFAKPKCRLQTRTFDYKTAFVPSVRTDGYDWFYLTSSITAEATRVRLTRVRMTTSLLLLQHGRRVQKRIAFAWH